MPRGLKRRRRGGGVALLALALALLGCSRDPDSGAALERSLAQLVAQQAAYDGRLVAARGVLRRYGSPQHYWLEDRDYNRVAVATTADLDARVGQTVRVRGVFRYDPRRGRRIEVQRLDGAGDTPGRP